MLPCQNFGVEGGVGIRDFEYFFQRFVLKPGYVVVHIGNPSTREVEPEASGVQDHPPLCSELNFKASLGYVSK